MSKKHRHELNKANKQARTTVPLVLERTNSSCDFGLVIRYGVWTIFIHCNAYIRMYNYK